MPELSHQHARLAAAIVVDLLDRTQLEITGRDRATLLQGLVTNDVKKLLPGQGCESFWTNAQGKILGHAYFFCRNDSLVLETVAGQAAGIIAHLDRYLFREDVQFVDRTTDWDELLVAGVRAEELLADLFRVTPPANLQEHVETEGSAGIVSIRRVDFVQPPAFFVACDRALAPQLQQQLVDRGAIAGSGELVEVLRIEAGTPLFGRDITDDNFPQELDRNSRAISFTKGCYLGQETVARIDALGHVNRTLVRVAFAGHDVPPVGTEITAGGKVVGRVTSACYSPRFQRPLALAYVRRGFNASGTKLTSAVGDAEVLQAGD